jgi:NitT/TauT family transport system permease protein
MNRTLGAQPPLVELAPPKRRRLGPLEPVSTRTRWVLGVAFFVLFVLVWARWAALCRPRSWQAQSRW